ncbi:MAG: hypothetical protein ACLPND_24130 [Candidatus Korobacteraceae bacterium]
MRAKAGGWALFVACLLLISFAATTPYSKTSDLALISLRLALVLVLSILVVRERWRHRDDLRRRSNSMSDTGDTILQRFRRWYYDEQKRPN